MDDKATTPPGWYPHPSMPGSLGYWDGERWTDHTAPMPTPAPTPKDGANVWTIARGVALGLAAVIAALVFLGQCAASDDGLECASRNVDRAKLGFPPVECP